MSKQKKLLFWRMLVLIISFAIITFGYYSYFYLPLKNFPEQVVKAGNAMMVARGRIEPLTRVATLTGLSPGGIVKQLKVKQGQSVIMGDVLAILTDYDIHAASVEVAEKSLHLAHVQYSQVTAGAKASELDAQRSLVTAKESEYERLRNEVSREEPLVLKGVVSEQALENKRSAMVQAQGIYLQSLSSLKSMSEFRAVDEAVAAAKVDLEVASLKQAEAALEQSIVRAPYECEILSIQAREGEKIGPDGIMRVADTKNLIVIAEVDEHFFPRLKNAKSAYVEGTFIKGKIEANIGEVSIEIFKQTRPSSDVLLGRDARIVEVQILPKADLPQLLGGEVLVHFVELEN